MLNGEDLIAGAARVALELAEEGAELLVAAYGSKAGVTLVYGNDPAWTCLPAGVAARIAVRHAGVFIRADGKRRSSADSDEQFKAAIDQWRRPQRAIIEQFAKAWVMEARAAAARSLSLHPILARSRRRRPGSFARVSALMAPDDRIAQFVAVSAFSSWLFIAAEDSRSASIIKSALGRSEGSANRFENQPMRSMAEPKYEPSARWASRPTSDWQAVRSWSLTRKANKENEVEKLIDNLASLKVTDQSERFYYCLSAAASAGFGKVPFAVTSLGSHVVWLDVLAVEVDRVRRALITCSSLEEGCAWHRDSRPPGRALYRGA